MPRQSTEFAHPDAVDATALLELHRSTAYLEARVARRAGDTEGSNASARALGVAAAHRKHHGTGTSPRRNDTICGFSVGVLQTLILDISAASLFVGVAALENNSLYIVLGEKNCFR